MEPVQPLISQMKLFSIVFLIGPFHSTVELV